MLRTQTHVYVFYMVIMYTEGLTCNRLQTMTISNYALNYLILRVVYCQSCKARLAHTSKRLCYLLRLLFT